VTPPATLNANLIALVAALVPGYTVQLPGILIEDMSSTAVGALTVIDAARVDAINNVSPGTANPYILNFLGQQFGIPQGLPANGSVYVVFTGSPGYVIVPGFLVSDGTYQYQVQDGGVIGSGGTSSPIYAVATNAGTFAIGAASVTQVVTAVPGGYSLTVTNPLAGVPASAAETVESYQSRLLQAWNSPLSGWQTYLKTLLQAVPGVNARLISIIPNSTNFEIICGGGDPYATAYAIYQAVSNIGFLAGSYVNSGRNVSASIYDAPNTYSVVFVAAQNATCTCAVTWNTTLANFTSSALVNALIIPAVQSYINGIVVGQPINLLVLTELIQQAISPVLSASNLTTLTFAFEINSSSVSPTAGTSIIPSVDFETALYMSATGCTSVQG